MNKKFAPGTLFRITAGSLVWFFTLLSPCFAQSTAVEQKESKDYNTPLASYVAEDCQRTHDVGNLVFGISNFGRLSAGAKPYTDCYTGARVPGGEFPKGSGNTYLYKAALWVGAIVGRDTLVSCGSDFNTKALEFHSDQPIRHRSTLDPASPEFKDAVSEQDFLAVYTDTFTWGTLYPSFDPLANRPHRPLGLEVTQSSYQWSYEYAGDFGIIEFVVRNIGDEYLSDVYLGVYVDGDVHSGGRNPAWNPPRPNDKGVTGGRDDLTGFLYDFPARYDACEFRDTVGIAWTVDRNGEYSSLNGFVVPHVTGFRLLGDLSRIEDMSYNWWIWNYNPSYDYGPQTRAKYRPMGNGLGTPVGDVNKYAMMSNHEIDFAQPYTYAISPTNPVWIACPNKYYARVLSRSGDAQYVLSVGPFQLTPGDEVTLPVAFVAGEDFHYNWRNFPINLGNNYYPDIFMEQVDLSDLAGNAMIASWIYDNPGVDTDGDGYSGESHICVLDSAFVNNHWVATAAETTFYEGDGIPDLTGATPPPAPDIWVTPTVSGLHIRFNGYRSENTRDPFSRILDFEGYRVYLSRDERASSYFMVASYDRENFSKMVYNPNHKPAPEFELHGTPFTLQQLRCLYGSGTDPCSDSYFEPLRYTASNPYVNPDFPDSIFYFIEHDYNNSELGLSTPIRKTYPHEPRPNPGTAITPEQLTEDGYLKYYQYDLDIENLLPSIPYYVNVTSFDFGSPETGLKPLESSKTLGSIRAFGAGSEEELSGELQQVYVYPNPYRLDDPYRRNGFEGRTREDMPDYRVRQINFANLPPKCTISIFSLDGDLVRRIDHDYEPSDPAAAHDVWDLVTRNRQLVVSGLYYWTVEIESGETQMGKLVILF